MHCIEKLVSVTETTLNNDVRCYSFLKFSCNHKTLECVTYWTWNKDIVVNTNLNRNYQISKLLILSDRSKRLDEAVKVQVILDSGGFDEEIGT